MGAVSEGTGIDRARLVVAAAWLVGGAAAVALVDGFLGASPAAAAVLGAVLVDLVAGRAGVRWIDPDTAPWARHLRAGLLLGATVGLAIVAAGNAAGLATVVLGAPGLAVAFAVLRVGAEAARDELLLRWMPLALGRRAGVPDAALLAFVVLVAVAPLAGAADGSSLAIGAATALLGGRLALATRGAVASAAAHGALALVLGPLTRGALVEVTWWRGDPGPTHAAGAAGWMAAIAIAAAALAVPRIAARLVGVGPAAAGAQGDPDQARARALEGTGSSISSNSASSTRTGPAGGATRAPTPDEAAPEDAAPADAPPDHAEEPEGTSKRTRAPAGTTPGKP